MKNMPDIGDKPQKDIDTKRDSIQEKSGVEKGKEARHVDQVAPQQIAKTGTVIGKFLKGIGSSIAALGFGKIIQSIISFFSKRKPTAEAEKAKPAAAETTSPQPPFGNAALHEGVPSANPIETQAKNALHQAVGAEEAESAAAQGASAAAEGAESKSEPKEPIFFNIGVPVKNRDELFSNSKKRVAPPQEAPKQQLSREDEKALYIQNSFNEQLQSNTSFAQKLIVDAKSVGQGLEKLAAVSGETKINVLTMMETVGVQVKAEFESKMTVDAMEAAIGNAQAEMTTLLDAAVKAKKTRSGDKFSSFEAWVNNKNNGRARTEVRNLLNEVQYSEVKQNEREKQYFQQEHGFPNRRAWAAQGDVVQSDLAINQEVEACNMQPTPWSAPMSALFNHMQEAVARAGEGKVINFQEFSLALKDQQTSPSSKSRVFKHYCTVLQADAKRVIEFPMNMLRQGLNMQHIMMHKLSKHQINLLQYSQKKSLLSSRMKLLFSVINRFSKSKPPISTKSGIDMLHSFVKRGAYESGITHSMLSFGDDIRIGIIEVLQEMTVPVLKMQEGSCKRFAKEHRQAGKNQFHDIDSTQFAKSVGDAFRAAKPTIEQMPKFLQSLPPPQA